MGKQDFSFLSDIDTSGREKGTPFPRSTLAGLLDDYGNKAVAAIKANLQKSNAIANDKLHASVRLDIKVIGKSYNFTINLEDYYVYVDQGSKPHWLPYDPVTKTFPALNRNKYPFGWIQAKKSLNVKNKFNVDAQRGLAYLIAKKIATKGTKGNKFFSKVVNQKSLVDLKKDISKAVGKDVMVAIKIIADDFKKQ